MEPCLRRGDLRFLTMCSKDHPVSGDVAVFRIDCRDIPFVHRIHSFSHSWLNASFHDVQAPITLSGFNVLSARAARSRACLCIRTVS